MLQRVIFHQPERFTRCSCGRRPRHIESRGRASNQRGLVFAPTVQHHLECRCGVRTDKAITLQAAEAQWGSDYAQLPLPLRRRRKVVA